MYRGVDLSWIVLGIIVIGLIALGMLIGISIAQSAQQQEPAEPKEPCALVVLEGKYDPIREIYPNSDGTCPTIWEAEQ